MASKRTKSAARAPGLRLEAMEDRSVPATLSLSGGVLAYAADPGESNSLTVTVSGSSYVLNDTYPITAVPAGWTGAGTQTVTGPTAGVTSVVLDLGDGTDALNLRSADDDLAVTSAGNLTVNLSSNAPANTGTVAGILGDVTVAGSGGGTNGVVVANPTGAGVTATVTASQVIGMLPGGKTIDYSNVAALRVSGSNTAADAFTVDVAGGTTAVRLDTNGGADTVAVRATGGATAVNTGAGDDAVTVGTVGAGLDDIDGALTVDAGAGAANALTVTDFAAAAANTVAVSASQITGFAPAAITYRAVGGAYGVAGAGITLDGSDAQADAFTLTGAAAVNKLTVRGNGGADTFTVTGSGRASLYGGADDDTFVLSADATALTGGVAGEGGTNTLSFAGRASAVAVTLTGSAAGSATGATGGFSGINVLTGGGAAGDTLTGANAATAWALTGANAGGIAGGPTFTAFENLTGGTGADTFSFGAVAGGVSGSIAGGLGANALDYAAVTGALSVTLTGAAAGTGSRIGGTFSGVAALTGNDTASTLTGANAANTWTVSGTNDGGITGGPTFTDFNNLTGGTANDTFQYAAGTGKTTGTVAGGGGSTNSVQFAGYAGGVTVDLQSAAASKTSGGASVVAALGGVNDYRGNNAGGDTLVGPNAANSWAVNAADGGTAGTVAFGGFENLAGGTGADAFAFTDGGSVSGAVAGGTGTDTLNFASRTGAVAVTLTSASAGTTAAVAGGFTGIEAHTGNGSQSTLIGYSAGGGSPVANTWTVSGTDSGSLTEGSNTTAFGGYARLTGGAGDDTFVYTGGTGKTTGTVAAGAGSLGSVQFQGYAGGVTVNLQAAAASKTSGGAAVVAAFSGVNDVESDAAAGDTLVGANATTAWAVTGANAGTVGGAVAFRAMENLRGGTGNDTFTIGASGSVGGTVDGGAGAANVLDYSATAGVTAVTLTALGGSVGFDGTGPLVTGGFRNVTKVDANAGTTNALTGMNAAATWTVDDAAGDATYASGGRTFAVADFQILTGGGAADTFTVANTAAGRIWTLKGGAGDDAFNVSHLDAQLGVLTLAGGSGADGIAVDDAANAAAANWSLAAASVTRDAVTVDYAGFESTTVTTGSGAVDILIESTGVGHTLAVNAGGSTNAIAVGLVSGKYDLTAAVAINLTNAASTDSLTIDDTAATPGAVEWTLTGSGVGRSGAAAIALTGTLESMVVTAGDGGATGNSFDVTGSTTTAFAVSGGAGSADDLTVHDGAATGTDDGVSRVTFTGGMQAVEYYDFDLAPVVVN